MGSFKAGYYVDRQTTKSDAIMKRFLFILMLGIIAVMAIPEPVIAQSDTTVTVVVDPPDAFPDLTGKSAVEVVITVGGWLISNWDSFLGYLTSILLTLSLFLRQWPTTKNVDILIRFAEWLDRWRLTKNRRKTGGRFVTKVEEQED